MATPTFYHPQLTADSRQVELSAAESAHAAKSRRLRAGQDIRLFDGKGLVAKAVIVESIRGSICAEVSSCQRSASRQSGLIIATAIPKGDRQRTMVDMLTQLGVYQIIPLQCEHSVTRFSDNMRSKWQRISVEACKQSQNPWLPTIGEYQTIMELLESRSEQSKMTFFYADGAGERMSQLTFDSDHTVILVGPEGGFSSAESAQLQSAGISPVRLSTGILRTETAAISAASQFYLAS